ncbi:MAG: hypothetical protein AB7R55_03955 [Gemmatimonadales bacterium]
MTDLVEPACHPDALLAWRAPTKGFQDLKAIGLHDHSLAALAAVPEFDPLDPAGKYSREALETVEQGVVV